MQEILKQLNDHSPGDLAELNDEELHRFENLCENWRQFAETERARRASLPRPDTDTEQRRYGTSPTIIENSGS